SPHAAPALPPHPHPHNPPLPHPSRFSHTPLQTLPLPVKPPRTSHPPIALPMGQPRRLVCWRSDDRSSKPPHNLRYWRWSHRLSLPSDRRRSAFGGLPPISPPTLPDSSLPPRLTSQVYHS